MKRLFLKLILKLFYKNTCFELSKFNAAIFDQGNHYEIYFKDINFSFVTSWEEYEKIQHDFYFRKTRKTEIEEQINLAKKIMDENKNVLGKLGKE